MVPAHVTNLREVSNQTLAGRITAGRQRLFVGRSAELAYCHSLLLPYHDRPVWSIVGPAGIGKTMLAQALVQQAADSGTRAAYLDAHRIPSNPADARDSLKAAMGDRELSAFGAGVSTAMLVIDGLEAWEDLRAWLRDDYLPDAPMNLRIVLCGRLGPDLQWRTDQGWQAVMHHTQLEGLGPEECREYLRRREVPEPSHADLIEFANGHPLALALAADSALAGHANHPGDTHGPETLTLLVESFSREAQSEAQRQALDACAIVRELNEPLLARMLGREDVAQLFHWLRGLSFMQTGNYGIRPHDLVREVLLRDLPRRAPGRYETYASAATAWIVDQIAAVPSVGWSEAAGMVADGLYALRGLPLVQQFTRHGNAGSLYLDRAGEDDWPALHDMVRRHESGESAQWFTFWQHRHPEAVYVIRDPQGGPRGFFLKLDMEALAPEDRDADPCTRQLWAYLQEQLALHPGDHTPFIRHWVTHDGALGESAETIRILMATNAYNLMARNLRATAQVFTGTPTWTSFANALGIRAIPEANFPAGETGWRIYYMDWQHERPARFYRNLADRLIAFQQYVDGRASIASNSPHRLPDEQAFKQAVEQALKDFASPRKLAANRLLDGALLDAGTEADAGTDSRVAALREHTRAAVAALDAPSARNEQWQEALHRAYLAPAASQKEAAAALHVSYPTFRRRLRAARQALADVLWQWEQRAR